MPAITVAIATACGADLSTASPGAGDGRSAKKPGSSRAQPSRRVAVDWCAGRKLKDRKDLPTTPVWRAAGFDRDKLTHFARAGCSDSLRHDERDEVLEAYRALRDWSALPAGDLRDYLSALIKDADAVGRACRDLKPRDDASRGLAKLLLCEKADELLLEDDTSSALASAGAVDQCLRAGRGPAGASALPPLATFALCGAEFRRLDRSALDRELAGLRVSPVARTRVRIGLREIETVLEEFEAKLRPALEKDPTVRALFYDIPERALRDAARIYQDGAEDVAAVRAYEALFARSTRPEVAGCFAELRPRLIARLRRARATTLKKVRHEMAGPIAYQLSRALESCARYDGQAEIAELLARELEGSRFFRGPRTMVYWSVRDALKNDAMKGRRPFELHELDDSRQWIRVPAPLGPLESILNEEQIPAPIRKISRQTGGLLVEFDTVVAKGSARECWDSKPRPGRARGGSPVQPEKCGKWEPAIRRSTEAPALIAAENAAGLAPGRPLAMLCDYSSSPRLCAPFAVWKDQNRDTLVSFIGAEL